MMVLSEDNENESTARLSLPKPSLPLSSPTLLSKRSSEPEALQLSRGEEQGPSFPPASSSGYL